MRSITLILFLIFVGCKDETKNTTLSEEGIDVTVYEMWQDYTNANPEFKTNEIPESFYFHNNKNDANRLADLVLSGKKKAGSSLYVWYKEANADLPQIGTKQIITDFEGKAKAIIETRSVDTIPFNEISEDYAAMDMGTHIDPLKTWRKAHWDFFTEALKETGQEPTENMLVVCEKFEIIWPKKKDSN